MSAKQPWGTFVLGHLSPAQLGLLVPREHTQRSEFQIELIGFFLSTSSFHFKARSLGMPALLASFPASLSFFLCEMGREAPSLQGCGGDLMR